MGACIPESLYDGAPGPVVQAETPLQMLDEIVAAARRRIVATQRAAKRYRLARDDGRTWLVLDRAVFVRHPAHDHRVRIDVRGRDVAVRTEHGSEGVKLGPGKPRTEDAREGQGGGQKC